EFRDPDDRERAALESLRDRLATWGGDALAEEYQKAVYEIGREVEFEPMRDWFRAIYEVLLGASQGPRFGGFIAMFGHLETARLIENRLRSTSRLDARE
ncbi:MAG: lysine--tRNA ligase, partial [Rhodobacteraceae bacterium]|nr:lysine--tRNA ligase [Paracoccaceae bacterium]